MSCGRVTYQKSKGFWRVECQPEPMIKLKRLFVKARPDQQGRITLSATPENSMDLWWFLQRYPMEVEPLSKLLELAEEHDKRTTDVAAILAEGRINYEFPLKIPLRKYQQVAASVAIRTGGLLLCDDLGLGKSCSAIGVLTQPGALPAVVVTLSHLPTQWQNEIHKFAPDLIAHIVKKGQVYNFSKGYPRQPDVLIINYHKLAGWADLLAKWANCVVFDEVQELRHGNSSLKGNAAYIIANRAKYRIGLSATPIYNYGAEMWNVMAAIKPDALGTMGEFLREWCTHNAKKVKDPTAFGNYLRDAGIMLRRTRAEVGRELPALSVIPYTIQSDTRALDAISSAAAELAKIILRQHDTYRGETMRASEELSMKLRHATGVGKAPYVAEFVKMVLASEERVVVYAWHRDCYSILESQLSEYNPVLYTGTETTKQKEESKQKFISGESRVMLMSLRAGAGLDGLQHVCRTVVFAELDWSPGVHQQNIGRVYRDGQKDPVVAYYLLANTGSDPVVSDVLGLKQQQADGICDPNAPLVETLQIDADHMKRLARQFLAQQGGKNG